MKYKITITKIEEKPIIKSIWVDSDELKERGEGVAEKGNYRPVQTVEKVSEDIYEQTVDHEIDLKGIIDAFNK